MAKLYQVMVREDRELYSLRSACLDFNQVKKYAGECLGLGEFQGREVFVIQIICSKTITTSYRETDWR